MEGLDTWNLDTIQGRQPFWRIQLRQLGVCQTDEPLVMISRAVSHCLQNDTARWLLSNKHAQSQCEYAIGYTTHNGETKTAVVDRTFVAEGVRWIIDYKMTEPTEGDSQEAFLRHQISQYKTQLEHYTTLFSQMDDMPIKTALYFPLMNLLEII
tara:strand:+ start:350 stop:811 length:462 start_codon:yes stop_codon:yes gene_type:complete